MRELHRTNLLRATDALGTAIAQYALPLIVLAITGSVSHSGVAFIAEWLPRIAILPIAGALVDRIGGRIILLFASLLRAVLTLAAMGLILLYPQQWWTVIIFGAVGGVLAEFSFLSCEVIGAQVQSGHNVHRVQARQMQIDQAALLIGPLCAAALVAQHPVAALGVVALLSLATAGGAPRLTTGRPQCNGGEPPKSPLKSMAVGWRMLHTPVIAWIAVVMGAVQVLVALLLAVAPGIALHQYQKAETDLGAMWTAAAVVTLLATSVTRRSIDRWGMAPLLITSGILLAAASAMAGTVGTFAAFALAATAIVAGECAANVVLRTMRTLVIPAHALGATVSVLWVIGLIPYPLAGLVVAVVPLSALPAVLAVSGITMGLAIVLGARQLGRHWQQHPAQAGQTDPKKLSAPVPALVQDSERARAAEPV
ncbi:MFS transporter [Streptomyces sp. NPDC059816]|uniref:MFS transporter n=1 Tax=Streptomyces sp. NPDC059816 TaxID=3346960 RepID=UPI00364D61ED